LLLYEALQCNFHASSIVINLLVKTSPDTVWVQDRFSCSPLHHALDCSIRSVDAADYLHLIKLLVENWPELLQKKTDRDGQLPLHMACQKMSHPYMDLI